MADPTEWNIKSGPLFLVPETGASAEGRGLAKIEGKALSMGVLKELIELVRRHVAVVVQSRKYAMFNHVNCILVPNHI
jgi:hypothetical protein